MTKKNPSKIMSEISQHSFKKGSISQHNVVEQDVRNVSKTHA